MKILSVAGSTSGSGIDLIADKSLTKGLLYLASIPVPEGSTVTTEQELSDAIADLGFPLVIKPQDGNHGRGVRTNIITYHDAVQAFREAKSIADEVVIEKFIPGSDYRLLMINYKLVAASKRLPAMVIGDGRQSVKELIAIENSNPMRGEGHDNALTRIEPDTITFAILETNGLTLDSVLDDGQYLLLKYAANLSGGGTAEDVTDLVQEDNVLLTERAARLLNLDICGIDVICNDISKPIKTSGGAIIEVNACPVLRMHLYPSSGQPRNVAAPLVEMLYPDNIASRIPIAAVTGTNGKTTTARLLAHIAGVGGETTGLTTTDGIYIDGRSIATGDCSGPTSAGTVLREPTVTYAVLECARGGILRSGLGFDHCDISIITNVTEDHLGLDDINTLAQMAKVKEVVAGSTIDNGYAILNADDPLVLGMRQNLSCNIALLE
jgi:cyanophycin synthetase